MAGTQGTNSPGPGVDAQGHPVVDPTQNVLQLVEAAIQRQDDLRGAEFRHVREIAEAEGRHLRELAELRAMYDEKLRRAESERIDAIRAVDVGAVNRAAEVSATQALTLAGQVATSAETLRTQAEAARNQVATSLSAALEPIQKDIQDLRRAQYEAQGVKATTAEAGTGMRAWVAIAIAAAVGGGTVILAIAGIVVTLLLRT